MNNITNIFQSNIYTSTVFLEYNSLALTNIVMFFALTGILLSGIFYINKVHCLIFDKSLLFSTISFFSKQNLELANKTENLLLKMYAFFIIKWFFDKFYNLLTLEVIKYKYLIFSLLDKGLFEMLGPFLISNILTGTSFTLINKNTGFLVNYYILMYNGVFVILICIMCLLII